MKIAFTSDLHVDVTRMNREIVPAMAIYLAESRPDVFILCGDISPRLPDLEETLKAFAALDCSRFFVAGNHDVWLQRAVDGAPRAYDSCQKYRELIPDLCERNHFTCLGEKERIVDGLGFAGAMGWFDYSFRNRALDGEIEMKDYLRGRFRNLQWNDFVHTEWNSLAECPGGEGTGSKLDAPCISSWMAQSLREQLVRLAASAPLRGIVVATHFLPVKEHMRYAGDPLLDFSSAYLGTEMMGGLIEEFPLIKWWICGHIHVKIARQWKQATITTSPLGYIRDSAADPAEEARKSITFLEIEG
jgi:hypothetical protein